MKTALSRSADLSQSRLNRSENMGKRISTTHVLFLTCLALFGTSTGHTHRHSQNEHTNLEAEEDRRGFRRYRERRDYNNWRWQDHSVFKYYDFIYDMVGRVSSNTRKEEAKDVKLLSDSPSDQPNTRLYFFGDSQFDVGNTRYISGAEGLPVNYYPYGFTYFTNATGRACDGRNIPDFIAEFANMPFIQPSLKPGADFSYGANFACSSSTVLTTNSTRNSSKLETLDGQVGQFKVLAKELNESLGSTQAKDILSKAVCIFNIGGADYLTFYNEYYEEGTDPTTSEQEQEVNIVVGNITENILELYGEGVRKFAFQSLGPLGCYPVVQSATPQPNGSCAEALLSLAMLHNKALYEALEGLAESLDGFNFTFTDYYTFLLDRIENPSDYGFEVPRTACFSSDSVGHCRGARLDSTLCEYPSAYLFFDESHVTQHANEQAALQFWNGSPNVTSSYSLKELFYY